jgi:hypothetical protein
MEVVLTDLGSVRMEVARLKHGHGRSPQYPLGGLGRRQSRIGHSGGGEKINDPDGN